MRHKAAFTDGVRGVWHRPDDTGGEKTLDGIKNVLNKFASTGINTVLIESFYHGMTVYRSDYAPYYAGFEKNDYGKYPDYLTAFVSEANKLGIDVHAWVEDFYIGVNENMFTREHNEWLLITDNGGIRQSEGGGYLFLDPANKQVREYLVNLYLEMLEKVKGIKGLNLDYIRYPLTEDCDTGFTNAAMNGFVAQYGITDFKFTDREEFIELIKSKNLQSEWTAFRADQITEFVKNVRTAVKDKFPHIVLSTAVFPEKEMSYNTKKQDFANWLKTGLLDIVTPMAYYDDSDKLKEILTDMIGFCGKTPCLAGLSCTYHNLSAEETLKQIEICKQTGADGFVFFGSKPIIESEEYTSVLGKIYEK